MGKTDKINLTLELSALISMFYNFYFYLFIFYKWSSLQIISTTHLKQIIKSVNPNSVRINVNSLFDESPHFQQIH